MKYRIPGYPYLYATACQVRHEGYREAHRLADLKARSRAGGHMTAGTTAAQHVKDVAEVRAYLEAHPTAHIWEVAMCCHLSDNAASRLMKEARG